MKVTKEIEYRAAGTFQTFYIPAGLKVIPATNLPKDNLIKYWLDELPENPTSEFEAMYRICGFGLYEKDVENIK